MRVITAQLSSAQLGLVVELCRTEVTNKPAINVVGQGEILGQREVPAVDRNACCLLELMQFKTHCERARFTIVIICGCGLARATVSEFTALAAKSSVRRKVLAQTSVVGDLHARVSVRV